MIILPLIDLDPDLIRAVSRFREQAEEHMLEWTYGTSISSCQRALSYARDYYRMYMAAIDACLPVSARNPLDHTAAKLIIPQRNSFFPLTGKPKPPRSFT